MYPNEDGKPGQSHDLCVSIGKHVADRLNMKKYNEKSSFKKERMAMH